MSSELNLLQIMCHYVAQRQSYPCSSDFHKLPLTKLLEKVSRRSLTYFQIEIEIYRLESICIKHETGNQKFSWAVNWRKTAWNRLLCLVSAARKINFTWQLSWWCHYSGRSHNMVLFNMKRPVRYEMFPKKPITKLLTVACNFTHLWRKNLIQIIFFIFF